MSVVWFEAMLAIDKKYCKEHTLEPEADGDLLHK